jgi:hypothetical protein
MAIVGIGNRHFFWRTKMNWIFHSEYEAQLVTDEEYEKLLENGWFDSPAKCVPRETKIEAPVISAAEKKEIRDEVMAEIKQNVKPIGNFNSNRKARG